MRTRRPRYWVKTMKEFENDDPMELQAIVMPEGDLEAQARFIIEEFSSMGMPEQNILELFRNPFYTGTHRLYQHLGEKEIAELIRKCNVGRQKWQTY